MNNKASLLALADGNFELRVILSDEQFCAIINALSRYSDDGNVVARETKKLIFPLLKDLKFYGK